VYAVGHASILNLLNVCLYILCLMILCVTGILQTCLRVGCDTHYECSAVSTQAVAVIVEVMPVIAVLLQQLT
jgi:hypothetical protein